ncbi:DUF2946 family protein [Stella sp.]|uniref:DUF2946 family protein n=1 Tax=Stella sp. TaxID=2912054 RepID=UPI0035B1D1B1
MAGAGAGYAGETRGAARRAWLSGLLVWTLVVQLLLPVLGPLRAGDGAAMAALGRIVPICTIDGLRLAEPATSDTDPQGDFGRIDGGWHCQLCLTPAVAPPDSAVALSVPVAWHEAWAAPETAAPVAQPGHRPQSARGPPARS